MMVDHGVANLSGKSLSKMIYYFLHILSKTLYFDKRVLISKCTVNAHLENLWNEI